MDYVLSFAISQIDFSTKLRKLNQSFVWNDKAKFYQNYFGYSIFFQDSMSSSDSKRGSVVPLINFTKKKKKRLHRMHIPSVIR